MDDKLVLSLNDLINLHYKQVDLVHKFSNYKWLAGAAVITVSVSYSKVALLLLAGDVPFAGANMWLIHGAQKEASLSSIAVRAAAASCEPPLSAEVSAVIQQIRPWSTWILVVIHSIVTSFVIAVLRERGL